MKKKTDMKIDYNLMRAVFDGNIIMKKEGVRLKIKYLFLGILKRNDKVHTLIIPNSASETLLDTVQTKIKPDSIITDSFRAYNKFSTSSYKHL